MRSTVQQSPLAPCPFHCGDAVYLSKGSYQGTPGVFLNLRKDPNWADIRETGDVVRAHPVEWLSFPPKAKIAADRP